jgi:signal transduction histidine kinase
MTAALTAASTAGAALLVLALLVVGVRSRRSSGVETGHVQWLASGAVVTATFGVAGAVLSVLVDWPPVVGAGFATGCAVIPLSMVCSRSSRPAVEAARVLVHTIVVGGIVGLVCVVYALVVLGLGRVPEGDERLTLGLSIVAAAVACGLAFPAKRRLEEWANQRVYGERHSPDEALRTFGGRMSRAVPMDELLLQLVETLKKTMHLRAAEIWTGAGGVLTRAVSVPDRGCATLHVNEKELPVVARAHAQGNAWIQVWVPGLVEDNDDRLIRSVPIAHLGELLGLIVLERTTGDTPFSDEEDQVLVELARQVGLALHNVRLDFALQESLEELQRRNEELVASRARIVAAADESRRQIERNLHDGAQQHLVALAVKVGLVKTLFAADPDRATTMLEELRDDVQATLDELRELAHGIYPPLLRDRGLGEALQAAANRATLPVEVAGNGVVRYSSDVEAAIYFCCLEALQNAGKHAGDAARVEIALGNSGGSLWFEVRDDGEGFDATIAEHGHGFVNMRDRLGAFGGELTVVSTPGQGTTITGSLPLELPRPPAAPPG